MAERPLLILIDGHAVAYRAFFALPVENFSTSKGFPTNAIYGFANTILGAMEEHPDYLAVSFDKGLSGRETLYPEYKGTREKMPVDLQNQLDIIEELVTAFNIPILAIEGYEADDLIGTAARQAEEQGCQVRIITGDRDLLQLVSDHIRVQLPVRGKPDRIWTVEDFKAEYKGLSPIQLIEYKALHGDSSDNIPGVAGIGEGGAFEMLTVYGTLEEIYAHVDDINKRHVKKLIAGREMAFLSRELATIKRDLPITLDLKSCVAHDFDINPVVGVLNRMQFGSRIRERLQALTDVEIPPQEEESAKVNGDVWFPPHTIVNQRVLLDDLVKKLSTASRIAFDTETTDIDKMKADLVGISLSIDGEHGYYIPVGHINPNTLPQQQLSLFQSSEDISSTPQQLPLKTIIDALRPALTNPNIEKVAHNAEYDLVILRRYGIDVAPITDDTLLAEWIHNPDSRSLGLKNLAAGSLHLHMQPINVLIGTGKKQITMDRVAIEDAAAYASADAVATFRLVDPLHQKLDTPDYPKARRIYQELEIPLIPVLANMEMEGVLIDTDYLAELSEEMTASLKNYEKQIHAEAGEVFNVNSLPKLNTILFEKLKLSTAGLQKTKTGGFSLTAAVLDELAEREDHPILRLIMEYRSLNKLLNTYIDALPKLVNARTGRVHTSFNQTGAVTGRLSSSNPNLQNIPIRTEAGRRVRRAFIAAPGNVLLSVDYSQIELRILAHSSGDDTLKQAFFNNEDIHRATAAKVNKIPLEAVTYDQRRFAKSVNFGLMYGMGAFRLARDSNLMLAEADAFIKTYFETFPHVRDYLEATKHFARQNGYVETLFGRRRMFPELQNETASKTLQARAEREAINAPIQGTAADIMKKAMIVIDQQLHDQNFRAKMLMQVHDELVFEVPDDEVETVQKLVVEIMQDSGKSVLSVPVIADSRFGTNWTDAD